MAVNKPSTATITSIDDYFPPIISYSKYDIRALLVDPKCNPAIYTGRRLNAQKLKRLIVGTKIGSEPLLKLLGFETEKDYDRVKIFTVTQSELILRELL